MYSTFTSSGLIGNPDLLENKKFWKFQGHFSLLSKLQEKQIDLNRVDKIFREHQPLCLKISEWTAVSETMEKLRKECEAFETMKPEVREILLKENMELIDEKINHVRILGDIELKLLGEMEQLFGVKGRNNLPKKLVHDKKKDIRQWPCFTYIMNDIYHRFKSYYDLEPRCQIPSQKNRHGKHSKELYKDIAILLEMYYPEYFKAFDWSNVKGRIKHPD